MYTLLWQFCSSEKLVICHIASPKCLFWQQNIFDTFSKMILHLSGVLRATMEKMRHFLHKKNLFWPTLSFIAILFILKLHRCVQHVTFISWPYFLHRNRAIFAPFLNIQYITYQFSIGLSSGSYLPLCHV